MRIKLFFNELCLSNWSCGEDEAKVAINNFVDVLFQLTQKGAEKSLCHPADLANSNLGLSYTISKWLADNSNDIELKRFLLSLLTKAPYFETLLENNGFDSSAHIENTNANGFLYCFNHEGIAVSLLSSDKWDSPYINIEIQSIDDNADVSISNWEVKHSAKLEHVQAHEQYIEDNWFKEINSGADLVALIQELYPNIMLCDNARSQIEGLSGSSPYLVKIKMSLSSLNQYLSEWSGGAFDLKRLCFEASPESESTLNKYSSERTFRCPDNVSRLFSYHIKFSPNSWRLYFIPDHDSKTALIGYIGKHLPIVSKK